MTINRERKTKPALWLSTPKGKEYADRKAQRSNEKACLQRTKNQTTRQFRGIKAVSKAQAVKNAEYERTKREWWPTVRGTLCPVMLAIFGQRVQVCRKPHHKRGRGKLLCDTRYWLAVADPEEFPAHRWIEDHKELARAYGWEAQRGEWGKAD